MLVIVMHNNAEYLESLMQLARKKNIVDATIVKKGNIGTRLIGGGVSFILSQGKMVDAYNKAFLATVKGEEETKLFLDAIKRNSFLDRINMDDKGFICAVPFHYIEHLEFESAAKKEEEDEMKITDFLKEERMILDLKATGKKEAIKEIAGLLGSAYEILDHDLFLKDIFDREAVATTGIGNGIAIPHARTDSVKDFVVAFGRSTDGVEFESLDGKPVKLIFVMGTPKNKDLNSYLMLLAHLTRLLNKQDFRERLGLALSPKEIIEAFAKQNGDSKQGS